MTKADQNQKIQQLEAEVAMLKRHVERSKLSRQQAEEILEYKARELFEKNEALQAANEQIALQLDSTENKLGMMVRNVKDIIYEVDHEGVITQHNNLFEGYLGYPNVSVLGKHYIDFVPPEYQEDVQQFYRNCVANQQHDSFYEVPITHQNGSIKWFGQNVHLSFKHKEGTFRAFVIARDITDAKKRRLAQEVENKRLWKLMSNLGSAVLLENAQREVEMTNQQFCDLFHIPAPPEAMKGADCSDAAEQSKGLFKDPEGFVESIEHCLADRKQVLRERLEMLNGTIVLRDYIPIWLDDAYYGHLWVYTNITEVALKDRAIAESEKKYTHALEGLNLGVIEVDLDERITKVFPKFEALTGYSAAELLGKNAVEVLTPPGDEGIKRIHEEIQAQRRKGQQSDAYETAIRRKDGSLINVMIAGAPIFNLHGESVGSIGVHFDITEQKKRQQELENAKRHQERITAQLSHELRNPITAIDGNLSLLSSIHSVSELHQKVALIRESVSLLKLLTDDALAYSTLASGKVKVQATSNPFHQYVQGLASGIESMAREKGIDFQLSIDEQVPHWLLFDKKLIGQVLINLLTNAVKFTRDGIVGLNVALLEDQKTSVLLQVEVYDSGIGIPQDQLEQITQEYFRAGNVQEDQTGTGLGLTIVQEVLHHHNAALQVDSEEGEGSVFRFTLELGKTAERKEDAQLENGPEKVVLNHVLVAEDNRQIQQFLEQVLRKYCSTVALASNGEEALEYVANHGDIDLLMVDYQMPKMDGIQLLKQLPAHDFAGRIFFMTANTQPSLRETANRYATDVQLEKPFMPKDLLHHLQRYFVLPDKSQNGHQHDLPLIDELNTDYLRELYAGSEAHLRESFNSYAQSISQRLTQIKECIENQQREELKFVLHKLKPSLAMVGLATGHELASELENACISTTPYSEIVPRMKQLIEMIQNHQPLVDEQLQYLQSK